jgi:HK97 gp10 family phage protein
MADSKIEGIADFTEKLRSITPAMRKRVVRNALAAGARLVRDEAKRLAPVLRPGAAISAPFRNVGTVKKAIRVRTSKADKRDGNIGVFVNVKPAKAGQRGAKNPNDPFYWRFLEFGTKKMAARPFLRPAADKLGGALKVFQDKMADWFDKAEKSGKITP